MFSNANQNKRFILFLLIFSLILFLYLIKNYLVTLTLAVIFTGILYPVYEKLVKSLNGRKSLASILMTIGFLLIIIIPTFYLLIEIINQATDVSAKLLPVLEQQIENAEHSNRLPEWFPFADDLQPYSEQIKSKMGELIGKVGGAIVSGIGSVTQGTMHFIIMLFIMLYAVYYFLLQGPSIIDRFEKFLPLSKKEFNLLKNQLYTTSWATIKGAIVIGLIQGGLLGLSFAIVGIDGALFWGAVAALASLIPSVGCALVYVPAAAILLANGDNWQGIFVLLWGLLIVGTVDNFLRPVLVGKESQISELTVLISTLGGIGLFGLSGVILGPMIASLFITVSNIYLEEKNNEI